MIGGASRSDVFRLPLRHNEAMSPATPLRRELLASLGILFGGVTLLLGIAISLVLPILRSPGEATAFILLVVGIDLVIVLAFGGSY